MRFLARRIVLAVAVVSAILTYEALRDFAWAFDLAIAVGYTVMVLGDGLTVTFLKGHSLAGQKATTILLTHACFLTVVVGVTRLMYYLKSTDEQLTVAQRSGRTYYDLVAIAVVVVLGLAERMMLFRPKEERVKAKATV